MNLNKDSIVVPANQIPSARTASAIERGVERNILMRTWGGLGDQICAEPTLRFALKSFKDCRVSLASECPELFGHLKFAEVFDLRLGKPDYDKFFTFDTIRDPTSLTWEFMSHMIVNCVDYPALCAFRCQLPVADREIILRPNFSQTVARVLDRKKAWVAVHAGRHWQSKTFPKWWWDEVLLHLKREGVTPVLIGEKMDDNRGTVDVNPRDCVDLRGQLKVMETVYLLQNAKVLVTNDSAPLHMAASGDAHIFYVATCKHPDYLTHWRHREWGWRMRNLGNGGIWDVVDYCPNKTQEVSAENVGEKLLLSWLPSPFTVAKVALAALS